MNTGRTVTAYHRIEPARPDEAEALTTLVRTSAAYPGHYRVMVANQRLDAAYLATNLTRVAHGADGQLWGFYSILVPGQGAAGEGELDFMFVANQLQGRGIGRALFEDLRATASQLGLARVHIVSHPPSERFYLACGARRIGEQPPTGRVSWARPHLALDLGPPGLAGSTVPGAARHPVAAARPRSSGR
ncbi:MAG: GNAT family N-acetyltransferase [Natronosporangium sp.]